MNELRKVSAHPNALFKAISDVTIHKKAAIANAVAAGVCIGLVALGWKGFVYGPAIIFLTYAVQVALNMFRRKDSTILSTVNLTMLFTILVMTIPFCTSSNESRLEFNRTTASVVYHRVHSGDFLHHNRFPR